MSTMYTNIVRAVPGTVEESTSVINVYYFFDLQLKSPVIIIADLLCGIVINE